MSDTPPEADKVKAARTFTAFLPTPKTQPEGGKTRIAVWAVGGFVVAALVVGALLDATLSAPAPPSPSAVAR